MKKSMKVILIVVGSALTLSAVAYCFVLNAFDETPMENQSTYATIKFPSCNCEVHIRAKMWGITGNHSEIRLSTAIIPEGELDSALHANDIVYKGATELYYKASTDTLQLFVSYDTEIPSNFSEQIIVTQVQFKNADEVQRYAINFKSYELEKISVYPSSVKQESRALPKAE